MKRIFTIAFALGLSISLLIGFNPLKTFGFSKQIQNEVIESNYLISSLDDSLDVFKNKLINQIGAKIIDYLIEKKSNFDLIEVSTKVFNSVICSQYMSELTRQSNIPSPFPEELKDSILFKISEVGKINKKYDFIRQVESVFTNYYANPNFLRIVRLCNQ